MANPSNLQVEWARTLLDSFARAGVTDVVVSPGSRSTPFLLAALEHPSLVCHDFLDERVAGFVALGHARATGRPSLLLCTSGTAATHYFAAIAEANVSHVPMLVLTTDRPSSLFASGESQTIDQVKLFGDHVRFFAELGAPTEGDAAFHALRRFAAQAFALSTGPIPGPCHLNVRAVRPLEPPLELTAEERAFHEHAARLRESPFPAVFRDEQRPSPQAIDALVEALRAAKRPLVVAGHGAIEPALGAALEDFARSGRVPVFAEAASQARFGARCGERVLGQADAIFRSPVARAELAPDLVIQIGGATIAKGLELLVAERAPARIVIAPHGMPDPTSRARLYVQSSPRHVLRLLAARLRRRPLEALDAAWCESLEIAESIAREQRDAEGEGALPWSEGAIARAVVASLPDGGALALGNSLAIREVDAYADPAPRRLRVLSQRGASGIDGLVAGFAGAVSMLAVPSALLVGDVSFLHDAGGVAALRGLRTPAVVVVVNNGGGRIFEQLPIAAQSPEVLSHFTTPHDANLAAVAAVHGVPFARVTSVGELEGTLREALSGPGPRIVEAVVPPHGATEQNRARFSRVAAALAARFPRRP